jgi:hypothetical protein
MRKSAATTIIGIADNCRQTKRGASSNRFDTLNGFAENRSRLLGAREIEQEIWTHPSSRLDSNEHDAGRCEEQ